MDIGGCSECWIFFKKKKIIFHSFNSLPTSLTICHDSYASLFLAILT